MCLFSLVSVFAGTIAWFEASRANNNAADSMQIASFSKTFQSLSYYALDSGNDSYYYFNQTASGSITLVDDSPTYSESDDVAMGEYTLLDRTHPMLMLITLSEEVDASESSITVSLSTESTYIGGYDDDGNLNTITETGNPLSSVIKFGCAYYSQSDFTSSVINGSTSLYTVPVVADTDFVAFVDCDTTTIWTDSVNAILAYSDSDYILSLTYALEGVDDFTATATYSDTAIAADLALTSDHESLIVEAGVDSSYTATACVNSGSATSFADGSYYTLSYSSSSVTLYS